MHYFLPLNPPLHLRHRFRNSVPRPIGSSPSAVGGYVDYTIVQIMLRRGRMQNGLEFEIEPDVESIRGSSPSALRLFSEYFEIESVLNRM